jgi:hypothetical protein
MTVKDIALRIDFQCPYCKVTKSVDGFLAQSRPQKLYEFDFRCENCLARWIIREVR